MSEIASSPRSRGGKSGRFLPSFRSLVRSASSLASTVRSAGSSVASTIISPDEDRQCEEVQWAGFDRIELGQGNSRCVLLLTYLNGFQVWDIEDASDVWELVSKRDGPVAFLRVQPQPFPEKCDGILKTARPLLLVVTTDSTPCRNNGGHGGLSNGYSPVLGSSALPVENPIVPTIVKFYSLRSHTYVHTLRFRTAIYAVRCSPRVVAVALTAQLYCFDAETLQSTFSVLTYPSPQPGSNTLNFGYGAMAVGPRWLAYAANQSLVSNTGRVSSQHLSPSPGVSPSTSPANASLVTHYAKESSKQIAAGIVTLGDLGYKAISRYYSDGSGSPVQGSPFLKGTSNGYPEHAGTVIVRDFVTKVVISQFRAHTSPLSALCFNPSGTLLVTASIHGHTINVFRIMPVMSMNGTNPGIYDASAAHVHLYKLSRGMTNAVIQDIAFSEDSRWIAVSSSRGTNHLFAISPFGGATKPSTQGTDNVFGAAKPWWLNRGPIKSNQQTYSFTPPLTVHASAISRIKNGSSGWCGTMMDAAAAAAATASNGKMNTSHGTAAVAVTFHDGRGLEPGVADAGQNGLKDQLWVLSSSGHLIRYGLHISEGYLDNLLPSQNSSLDAAMDVRVIVEPLQKWDVCRRLNWVEREEKINNSATEPDVPNDLPPGSCHDSGAHVDQEHVISSEMRQLFLSNAEVSMHHCCPPIWAKSQVCFQVFIDTGTFETEGASGGEVEIEKFNTKVVKVKKQDLVPVFDMFKEYQFGEGLRVYNNGYTKDGHATQILYSGIPNGTVGIDIGVLPIHRSCTGGSCGTDGGPHSLSNATARQPDQDTPAQLIPNFLEGKARVVPGNTLKGAYFASINLMPGGAADIESNRHDEIEQQCKMEHAVFSNVKRSPIMTLETENGISFASTNGHTNLSEHFPTRPFDSDVITFNNRRDGDHPNAYELLGSDKSSSNGNALSHADNFGLHEYDVPTEEVESNDGNSKSEEHGEDGWEGAMEGEDEQGEDGWEGAMFPFTEDS